MVFKRSVKASEMLLNGGILLLDMLASHKF